MGDKLKVKKEDLQILFDALVHSMDFGSGFLDDEEVTALRSVAVVLEVDPKVATPEDFRHKFPHSFQDFGPGRVCGVKFCTKPATDEIHKEAQ